MGGKVYLIQNGQGHYKIGRTNKKITERIKQLQTGSATELFVICECFVKYPTKVESTLHRHYAPYQMIGEWFNIPQYIADNFINAAKQIDNTIIYLKEAGNPFI